MGAKFWKAFVTLMLSSCFTYGGGGQVIRPDAALVEQSGAQTRHSASGRGWERRDKGAARALAEWTGASKADFGPTMHGGVTPAMKKEAIL